MLTTSFALLHANNACIPRYRFLAKALGGIKAYGRDTEIPLSKILETNGVDDALWALCRALPVEAKVEADRIARLFACDRCDRVRHLMEDERSPRAVDGARLFANGEASEEELAAARAAARDAELRWQTERLAQYLRGEMPEPVAIQERAA